MRHVVTEMLVSERMSKVASTGWMKTTAKAIPTNAKKIITVKYPMAESQGLLHSPTRGTYPQWLVWGTSCPILFLLLVAM